mgnify:CR=1 FL=1
MTLKKRPKTMSCTVKDRAKAFLLLALLALLPACASTPHRVNVSQAQLATFLADKPPVLKSHFSQLLRGGKRDQVLNQVQTGLAAFEAGEYTWAENLFDQALAQIEAVYADNPQAEKARSLWYNEDVKDFKGEPYERVMTYYYRGLLYLRQGDYENARACFKSSILQDAFAEEGQNRFDFALVLFLEGWCSRLLGDEALAQETFAELKLLRPDLTLPGANHNTLVIVETGNSPRKVSDGIGHAELKYRRGKNFSEAKVSLEWNNSVRPMYPIEDIYRQAATRGGRPVDKILDGKVFYMRKGMEIGSILSEASTVATMFTTLASGGGGGLEYIGGALSVAGGVTTLVSMNIKTHADTRYWNNLPDGVHIFTTQGSPSAKTQAIFLAGDGSRTELHKKPIDLSFDRKGHGFAWSRSRTAL